jgi:uncharacterized protein (DUF924 family)
MRCGLKTLRYHRLFQYRFCTTRTMEQDKRPMEDVLSFWFQELKPEQHFRKDAVLDEEIKRRFGNLLTAVEIGEYDQFASESALGALSTIVVLDQFSRNVYRNTPNAFANDHKALEITLNALIRGYDKELESNQTPFLLMPLMHSEDIEMQEKSVQQFHEISDKFGRFAISHRDIVKQFGRFPHRNEILGRISTQEEIDFLKTEGSSF